MLIGYNPKNGYIEFLFSDTSYLKKMFPDNTAKITNFWKILDHGLRELFVDEKDFPDYMNYGLYKVVDGKIIKKTEEETRGKTENKIRPVERVILDN